MKRMGGMQSTADDAARCQRLLQRIHRLVGSGDDAQRGAVDGCDGQCRCEQRPHVGFGQPYRQHRAAGQLLHQPAASRHDGQRVLEREYAGEDGRDEFAHAMADHRRRLHAPAHPQFGQRVFHAEDGGLRRHRGHQSLARFGRIERRIEQLAQLLGHQGFED